MVNENGILLASGGLDSTTLAYWLVSRGIDFVPLFIDYGQHCSATEFSHLKKVLPNGYSERIEFLDIKAVYKYSKSKFIKEGDLWNENFTPEDLYIPYRNTLILTIAASMAQSMGLSTVYSAFINSNHAKEIDCSNEFFDKLDVIFSEYGSVKIQMPFRHFSKFEVAKIGITLGAPIGATFSCQASSSIPCGACPNCVDRLEALRRLEMEL